MKNDAFIKQFIVAVKRQGGLISKEEALQYMEDNPVAVLHETPKQFAKSWIENYDDDSDASLTYPPAPNVNI